MEWTNVPRKMCARDCIEATHKSAAGRSAGSAGGGGRTGRRRGEGSVRPGGLQSGRLSGWSCPRFPGLTPNPAGRAPGRVPWLFRANRIFLSRLCALLGVVFLSSPTGVLGMLTLSCQNPGSHHSSFNAQWLSHPPRRGGR